MRRNKPKHIGHELPNQVVMAKLQLSPTEWTLTYSFGKPFLGNPGNHKSWVEYTITYLPTNKTLTLGERGKFTRQQARL